MVRRTNEHVVVRAAVIDGVLVVVNFRLGSVEVHRWAVDRHFTRVREPHVVIRWMGRVSVHARVEKRPRRVLNLRRHVELALVQSIILFLIFGWQIQPQKIVHEVVRVDVHEA